MGGNIGRVHKNWTKLVDIQLLTGNYKVLLWDGGWEEEEGVVN